MKRTANFAILVLTAISILIPLNAGADDILKGIGKFANKAGEVLTEIKKAGGTERREKEKETKRNGKLRTTSDVEGVKLKIKSCTADEDDNVIIEYTLRNTTDRDIKGYCDGDHVNAIDDEGNIYSGVGNVLFSQGKGEFVKFLYDSKYPAGLPVKFRIKIKNVEPEACKFERIDLYLNGFGGKVHAYNLPINRDTEEEEEVEID